MSTLSALIIIGLAALIHASFQLSVSVLTLLSSHTIGAKRSHTRLIKLTNAFVFGVAIMTLLLVSFLASVFEHITWLGDTETVAWVVLCGLLIGLGIAVWLFYYRKGKGTVLWIPRPMASYLTARTKATKQSAEAFGLGLSSVIGELLFIIAPVALAALTLTKLSPSWQVAGLLGYTLIATISLLIVNGLIGSGHKLSRIQRWREENRSFLQFTAGSGLMVLGFYLYVEQVLTPSVMAAAGGF